MPLVTHAHTFLLAAAGALKERAGRAENEDREDRDDEAPQVVDAELALTSKERRKLEAKPRSAAAGGSLSFKGDDNSAAGRFRESAYVAVVAAEESGGGASSSAAAEGEPGAAPPSRVVFKAAPIGSKPKKRKPGAGGVPAARAVKNAKLLSFDEEDG